jgi:hypothetical protein
MGRISRRFLLAGGALIAACSLVGAELWRRTLPGPAGEQWRSAWAVLVPAVLGRTVFEAAKNDAELTCLARIDQFVGSLPKRKQAELRTLVYLGDLPLARGLLLGMPAGWSELTPEAAGDLLERWSKGDDLRLRLAAKSLRSIVRLAWYSQPATWPAIAYPGPPDIG